MATAEHARLLTGEREKFETDDAIAYFNTANLSPLLHRVRAAGEESLLRRAKPWTISPKDWFPDVEALRAAVGRLIGATAEDVALVPATSYGLAALARNLSAGPGERVLVLDEEFPSNYYTWKRLTERTGAELVVVEREPGETWTEAILDEIDERVAIASLPNVHWTNGALVELEQIAPVLREAGSTFVVDASQSLGAMPLDVAALRPDALVTVGYKWLLGPYSLGLLYLDPALQDGEPLEENWLARRGSDDFTRLVDYQDAYEPGARRFDVGERSNFHLVPMLLAAVEQLLEWEVPRIAATLKTVTDEIVARIETLGLSAPQARAPHMLGLEFPPEAARRVAASLAEASVIASVRGSSLRIAPHLHVSNADVDRLVDVVASAV